MLFADVQLDQLGGFVLGNQLLTGCGIIVGPQDGLNTVLTLVLLQAANRLLDILLILGRHFLVAIIKDRHDLVGIINVVAPVLLLDGLRNLTLRALGQRNL